MFWETFILNSIVAATIYNPTNSAPRFSFLNILVNMCLLLLLAKFCPTLWPNGLQHTRFLCPSLSPEVCSDSSPLNWWWWCLLVDNYSETWDSNTFIVLICIYLMIPNVLNIFMCLLATCLSSLKNIYSDPLAILFH